MILLPKMMASLHLLDPRSHHSFSTLQKWVSLKKEIRKIIAVITITLKIHSCQDFRAEENRGPK